MLALALERMAEFAPSSAVAKLALTGSPPPPHFFSSLSRFPFGMLHLGAVGAGKATAPLPLAPAGAQRPGAAGPSLPGARFSRRMGPIQVFLGPVREAAPPPGEDGRGGAGGWVSGGGSGGWGGGGRPRVAGTGRLPPPRRGQPGARAGQPRPRPPAARGQGSPRLALTSRSPPAAGGGARPRPRGRE